MKRCCFTLVELLTVIAVIAILAGIAIPVVVGMQSKGRETSARADMNAIKLALTQFKADYSVWPQVGPDSSLTGSNDLLIETPFSPASTLSKAEEAYDKIIQSLTNNTVDATTPTAPTGSDLYGNTRKRRYLDPPAKTVETKNPKTGYYKLDPWGRRYNIALDWNYNGKIDLSSSHKFAQGKEENEILGQILIYSYGTAEDADDTDAFLYSWKTNAD